MVSSNLIIRIKKRNSVEVCGKVRREIETSRRVTSVSRGVDCDPNESWRNCLQFNLPDFYERTKQNRRTWDRSTLRRIQFYFLSKDKRLIGHKHVRHFKFSMFYYMLLFSRGRIKTRSWWVKGRGLLRIMSKNTMEGLFVNLLFGFVIKSISVLTLVYLLGRLSSTFSGKTLLRLRINSYI